MTTYRPLPDPGGDQRPPWLHATGTFAERFSLALQHLRWQLRVAADATPPASEATRPQRLPSEPRLSVTMHLKTGTNVTAVTAALVQAFSERGIDVASISCTDPRRGPATTWNPSQGRTEGP